MAYTFSWRYQPNFATKFFVLSCDKYTKYKYIVQVLLLNRISKMLSLYPRISLKVFNSFIVAS